MILRLYNQSIVSVIVCAVLATSAIEGAVSSTPAVGVPLPLSPSVMTTDYVRITAPWLAIPIEGAPMTCEVGKHVMLIQENDDFFITMCSNEYNGVFLAAFPVKGREGRLAWTTPERKVIFAYRTSSCRGKMYFRQGDILPVDAETHSDYQLRIECFNHVFLLYLPQKSRGIEFTKAPPLSSPPIAVAKTAQKKAQASVPKTSTVPVQKIVPSSSARPSPGKQYMIVAEDPSTNLFSKAKATQQQSTPPPGKKEAALTKTESVQTSEPPVTTDAATNKATVAASLSIPSQEAETKKIPETKTPGFTSSFTKYQTPLIISISLVFFIIGLYWKSRQRALRHNVAPDTVAKALPAGADGSDKPPPFPTSSNDMRDEKHLPPIPPPSAPKATTKLRLHGSH